MASRSATFTEVRSDRPEMKYRDYAKGSSSHETGDFVAVCADSDGWFWRNLTAETVAIALETSGADSAVKRVG